MDTEDYKLETKETLASKLAHALRKIDELERAKRRVGISFSRVPETGSEIDHLFNGDFPYFQHNPELSYSLADRHKDEKTASKVLSTATDGNITLIEGDNLPVLAALQLTHKGRVDVIYIDPPYNTGNNDFIYNDARKSSVSDVEGVSIEDYETKLDGKARSVGRDDPERHSLWLSFMEKRLYLARELLSETGVIFVSIDDNEQARLKLLMDEVFGEQNFVSTVTWAGGAKNNARFISNTNDYFLVYNKSSEKVIEANIEWRLKKTGIAEIQEKAFHLLEKANNDNKEATKELKKWYKDLDLNHPSKTEKANSLYLNISEDGRIYKIAWPDAPKNGPRYELLHPNGKPVKIPAPGWRFTKEKMLQLIGQGEIVFLETETKLPILKRYLDATSEKILSNFFIADRRVSNVKLQNILGRAEFDFPKDELILQNWIQYVSARNKDAIVLDFFAGSGTTGHAVAKLNKEDGGSRQCILVTHGDENGKNIAEDVTAQRMLRVLSGKNWADGKAHDSLPGELNYYKLAFAPKTKNVASMVEIMQTKFVGFAALQQDVVLLNEFSQFQTENFSLLGSSKKIVIVVKDEDYLLEGADEFYEVLDQLANMAKKYEEAYGVRKELIVYTPSDESEDVYSFAGHGWSNISYPLQYVLEHTKLVNNMKKNKTLLPPGLVTETVTEDNNVTDVNNVFEGDNNE